MRRTRYKAMFAITHAVEIGPGDLTADVDAGRQNIVSTGRIEGGEAPILVLASRPWDVIVRPAS